MKKFINEKITESQFNDYVKIEAKKQSKKLEKTKLKIASRDKEGELKNIKNIFYNTSSILCIGCRDDSEVIAFKKYFTLARGIDICNKTEEITKIPAENIDTIYKNNEFDLIYSSHSLEHMIYPSDVLKNIRKISKNGFYVILPYEKPLTTPCKKHKVIFNVSFLDNKSKIEDIDAAIKLDFVDLEPYTVSFLKINNLHEIHIAFKW